MADPVGEWAQHPAAGLVLPPQAVQHMRAPHERPPLAPDTRVDGIWIWLLVTLPWLFSSTIFLFDVGLVIDELRIGAIDAALEHVATHAGIVLASSAATIAIALWCAHRDARDLRRVGVERPFPWGFAAIAGLVYVIGRHVVLRGVTRPSPAPLAATVVLYVVFYLAFGVWAIATVTTALSASAA